MMRFTSAMPKLSVLLTTSFILAGIGGLAPWSIFRLTGDNSLTTDAFVLCAFVVGPAWALLALALLWRYRKHGLWVLIGLPFALACTGIVLLYIWAAFTGRVIPL